MATQQKIRIRLKAFDYKLIDQSAAEIVPSATMFARVPVAERPACNEASTNSSAFSRERKRPVSESRYRLAPTSQRYAAIGYPPIPFA